MKRLLSVLFGLLGMLGLVVLAPAPASAAPGHVTLSCGSYVSTGWVTVYYGIARGRVCMTLHNHGDHVDVTYWAADDEVDGIDIKGDRDLSYVSDGWVTVVSPTGGGTVAHENKQYPVTSDVRWVQMRGWTDPGYTIYETGKLYW